MYGCFNTSNRLIVMQQLHWLTTKKLQIILSRNELISNQRFIMLFLTINKKINVPFDKVNVLQHTAVLGWFFSINLINVDKILGNLLWLIEATLDRCFLPEMPHFLNALSGSIQHQQNVDHNVTDHK